MQVEHAGDLGHPGAGPDLGVSVIGGSPARAEMARIASAHCRSWETPPSRPADGPGGQPGRESSRRPGGDDAQGGLGAVDELVRFDLR
jgi:hypothetical protein